MSSNVYTQTTMIKNVVAELNNNNKKRMVNNTLDTTENWIRQRTSWLFTKNILEKGKQGENTDKNIIEMEVRFSAILASNKKIFWKRLRIIEMKQKVKIM